MKKLILNKRNSFNQFSYHEAIIYLLGMITLSLLVSWGVEVFVKEAFRIGLV